MAGVYAASRFRGAIGCQMEQARTARTAKAWTREAPQAGGCRFIGASEMRLNIRVRCGNVADSRSVSGANSPRSWREKADHVASAARSNREGGRYAGEFSGGAAGPFLAGATRSND